MIICGERCAREMYTLCTVYVYIYSVGALTGCWIGKFPEIMEITKKIVSEYSTVPLKPVGCTIG